MKESAITLHGPLVRYFLSWGINFPSSVCIGTLLISSTPNLGVHTRTHASLAPGDDVFEEAREANQRESSPANVIASESNWDGSEVVTSEEIS